MDELVSVVVPIYGVEKYLQNCVESIINQIYTNIEIILVDDGSLDRCGQICDNFKVRDSRVTVIHKENGGLSDARNTGIKIAQGKYITFVDGDDYIAEDYVSILMEKMLEENADISICKLKMTSNMYEDSSSKESDGLNVYTSEEALEQMLYACEFSTSACGRIFRTELFEDVRFPIGKYSEDLYTIYKTIRKAYKIILVKREAYFYYSRPGSITNEKFSRRQLDTIEALHIIRKDVIEVNAELYPAYKNQMVEAVARLIKMNIPKTYLYRDGLWDEVKHYKFYVIMDQSASKRVRAYAFLMILGPGFMGKVMRLYYKLKWRKSLKV